jgi:hypothetical protein
MVGFGTTKLTRVWEPALLWNQLRVSGSLAAPSADERSTDTPTTWVPPAITDRLTVLV